MKRYRWTFWTSILLLVASLFVAYFGFRTPSTTTVQRNRVSVIVNNSTSGRWARFQAGLEQAADDYDISLNYVFTSEFASLSEEEKVIRNEAQSADAILLELVDSTNASELIGELCRTTVLGLVETDATAEVGDNFASITADNSGIGIALAEVIAEEYDLPSGTVTIGILSGNQKMDSMRERTSAFTERIKELGGDVQWIVQGSSDWTRQRTTDVVVAMDNDALENAVDLLETSEETPALYGVGCSDKTIFNMDRGLIRAMVVPNDFQMGYLALMDVNSRIDAPGIPMIHREISYDVVKASNMFDSYNQTILFPIIN